MVWSRIANVLDPADYVEIPGSKLNGQLPRIYIYCLPCKYAMDIALSICYNMENFEGVIRVDDRLLPNGGSAATAHQSMKVIDKALLWHELGGLDLWCAGFMDDAWVERRIHCSKVGFDEDDTLITIENLFIEHREDKLCAAIIVVTSADHCNEMTKCLPVISNGIVMEENEIFELIRVNTNGLREVGWKPKFFMEIRG